MCRTPAAALEVLCTLVSQMHDPLSETKRPPDRCKIVLPTGLVMVEDADFSGILIPEDSSMATEVDHPHIIRLHEWYEGSSKIYLVMDAIKARSILVKISQRDLFGGVSKTKETRKTL
eukprot:s1146_g15.t1